MSIVISDLLGLLVLRASRLERTIAAIEEAEEVEDDEGRQQLPVKLAEQGAVIDGSRSRQFNI